jgi:hypothetical protein
MVKNYTVVQAENIPALIVKVNALIAMGWQPLGGPAFEVTRNVFIQAMWTDMTS